MTETRLVVGPFNRVEGDLEIHLDVAEGAVQSAYVNSPLYRGFERMLLGKGPMDALTITPRICGICSISQSMAAALALSEAAGTTRAPEGEKVAALLHAVENLSDHLTHFYVFFMPDFARPTYAGRAWHDRVVSRFTAMEGSGLQAAVEARARLTHIVGLLGGKWPHTLAIQPGGVTRTPTLRDKIRIASDLRAFRGFLEDAVFGRPLEDIAALTDPADLGGAGDFGLFCEVSDDLNLSDLGRGSARYLSFGAYPGPDGPMFRRGTWQGGALGSLAVDHIAEDLTHAWMQGATAHPNSGQTVPDVTMADPAYSWCKAPRLAGQTYETGALARQVIDGHPLAVALAEEGSVRARVVGRLLELAVTQIALEALVSSIDTEARFMQPAPLPQTGQGAGLVEAARGALGHWCSFENGKITNYQIVAPTTWNFSPRDSDGTPGPVEAALVGASVAPGEDTPITVQHIVRSFDPCMVCTVH